MISWDKDKMMWWPRTQRWKQRLCKSGCLRTGVTVQGAGHPKCVFGHLPAAASSIQYVTGKVWGGGSKPETISFNLDWVKNCWSVCANVLRATCADVCVFAKLYLWLMCKCANDLSGQFCVSAHTHHCTHVPYRGWGITAVWKSSRARYFVEFKYN